MNRKSKEKPPDDTACAVLPGFKPLPCLYEGPQAAFKSEQTVRWLGRRLRVELVAAQAVARWERSLWVHPEKFVEVVRKDALTRLGRPFEDPAHD